MSASYSVGDEVVVNDRMQQDYRYRLSAPAGADFGPGFEPFYSPPEMLTRGVFEGKYCNDCRGGELPEAWFAKARISDVPDPACNYFRVKSRQPLSVWRDKGWIREPDPRGWFQWYCRYYLGRRIPHLDEWQIKRWRGFRRHAGQVRANCDPGDWTCRPRQRQALLQWAHDSLV